MSASTVRTPSRFLASCWWVVFPVLAGCAPSTSLGSPPYRSECVGRLEFSLPAPVEVAAYRSAKLQSEMLLGSNQQWFEFADGTDASHARLDFFGSGFISHHLNEAEFSRLLGEARSWRDRARRLAKEQAKRAGTAEDALFSDMSVGKREGIAWRFDKSFRAFLRIGDSALLWKVTADAATKATAQAVAAQVIARSRARALHEIPTGPGVCAPNLFIADDGLTTRDVRSFYRLVDQPDVRVLLKDATAVAHEPGNRTRNNDSDAATVMFWSQLLTQAREVKPLWTPTTRSVLLAGKPGLASFVQLTRDDNTIDYGFLAIVRGDPGSKEDAPDLMLYVIQDSKHARAKGQRPMSKEAFIETAETIAASVKRRPIR